MRLGGDTGENRGELAGIAWEEMGWMGVGVGMAQRGGQAAGPAAEPPTRAEPVCFDAVETACGRVPAPCRDRQRDMSRSRWVRAADLPGKPLENAEKPHKIFDKP